MKSLFVLNLLAIVLCDTSEAQQLFNLAIHDESSPLVQETITNARSQLNDQGYFLIPNFLSQDAISIVKSTFETALSQDDIAWPEVYRNVFQQQRLNSQLSTDHPFNTMLYNRIGFIGKSLLTTINVTDSNSNLFLDLYNSTSLYQFLSDITTVDIYPSTDNHGSIYGLIGFNDDVGNWHFDEHPFSCVWMIRQAQKGGDLRYVNFNPEKIENENENENGDKHSWSWDYELLSKILNNDAQAVSENVNTIYAQSGDVYCFWGNVSLHGFEKIEDDSGHPMPRQVFVTAFSTEAQFKHSSNVHECNDWKGSGDSNPKSEL